MFSQGPSFIRLGEFCEHIPNVSYLYVLVPEEPESPRGKEVHYSRTCVGLALFINSTLLQV